MTLSVCIRQATDLIRSRRGTAIIEFAVLAPVMLLLVLGTFQFGLVISHYVLLTNAVGAGARYFALSRGSTTPYSDTVGVITGSSTSLTSSSITVTVSVNGTACTSDSTCKTALSNAASLPATVAATYPCSLSVYGYNFAPNCTLSAQMTGLVM